MGRGWIDDQTIELIIAVKVSDHHSTIRLNRRKGDTRGNKSSGCIPVQFGDVFRWCGEDEIEPAVIVEISAGNVDSGGVCPGIRCSECRRQNGQDEAFAYFR